MAWSLSDLSLHRREAQSPKSESLDIVVVPQPCVQLQCGMTPQLLYVVLIVPFKHALTGCSMAHAEWSTAVLMHVSMTCRDVQHAIARHLASPLHGQAGSNNRSSITALQLALQVISPNWVLSPDTQILIPIYTYLSDLFMIWSDLIINNWQITNSWSFLPCKRQDLQQRHKAAHACQPPGWLSKAL